MEDRIIQRIRENKRKIYKLYKLVKKNIDMEAEIVDSTSLQILSMISKIDEELTDIIYLILNSKNS